MRFVCLSHVILIPLILQLLVAVHSYIKLSLRRDIPFWWFKSSSVLFCDYSEYLLSFFLSLGLIVVFFFVFNFVVWVGYEGICGILFLFVNGFVISGKYSLSFSFKFSSLLAFLLVMGGLETRFQVHFPSFIFVFSTIWLSSAVKLCFETWLFVFFPFLFLFFFYLNVASSP